MLRDRNIAFFIDVDNVGLSSEQYADITSQLGNMGAILSGRIYGAGERKHREIYADADLKGYATARPMRVKRRGRKDFDARIFVDVVDCVSRAPAIDTVCIVAQPTDLVHLYSYLHGRGIKIVALTNADEASIALIDEALNVAELTAHDKTPKKPVTPTPKKPAPKKAVKDSEQPAPTEEQQRTDELLREIERLRALADSTREQPAEQPTQPTPTEQPAPEPKQEPTPAESAAGEQAAPTSAPRAAYTPSNERDLIRRIEEIRNSSQGDDDEFIEEIRKLLDGIDD